MFSALNYMQLELPDYCLGQYYFLFKLWWYLLYNHYIFHFLYLARLSLFASNKYDLNIWNKRCSDVRASINTVWMTSKRIKLRKENTPLNGKQQIIHFICHYIKMNSSILIREHHLHSSSHLTSWDGPSSNLRLNISGTLSMKYEVIKISENSFHNTIKDFMPVYYVQKLTNIHTNIIYVLPNLH